MEIKRKVILAIGCSKIGGAQKVFATITRELIKEGNNVTVVLPEGPLANILRNENVEIITLKFKSYSGLLTIAKILRRKDIDIINTHLTNCSFLFTLVNIFYKKKICCSLHNAIIHEGLGKLQKIIYPFFYFLIGKLSDGIIVNSEKNKAHFIDVAHIKADRIRIIYNGIDDQEYLDEGKFINHDIQKFHIGYIGRLSIEKGVIYLIKALYQLQHIDFECSIIGEGPLRTELEEEVVSSGLKDKVKFYGFQQNVVPYFRKMDLFVLPSLNEVLPITIIEAFALRVITIASDVGGVPDLITEGRTGLLFPAKDVNKLVEKINWVYKHEREREILIENAYNKFIQTFTSQAMIKQITDYYDFIRYNS